MLGHSQLQAHDCIDAVRAADQDMGGISSVDEKDARISAFQSQA